MNILQETQNTEKKVLDIYCKKSNIGLEGEIKNGANADYRIYSVRNQNTCIRIYLLKLVKED